MMITKETFDKYRQGNYPNFAFHEIACSCCGELKPKMTLNEFLDFMTDVQCLRDLLKRPITLASAWRCEHHELNILKKKATGQHNIMAVDVRCSYENAYDVLDTAFSMKVFKGIGISQKGDAKYRFIHLDPREVKALWSY